MPPGPDGERLVAVGRFGRPHGLRGEIRLDTRQTLPRGLDGYRRFFTEEGDGVRPVEIESWRAHGDALLVTLAGVKDREAAAGWTNRTLFVPREDMPPLEEGEYYHADLIGAALVDEEDAELGRVEDVMPWGDYDMLIVRTAAKTWMLPVVSEYVLEMEPDAGRIRVRVPEGLGP